MNTDLALRTIEALEPYARRLVERAEQRGAAYGRQWSLALAQARMVLAAFDADPGAAAHAAPTVEWSNTAPTGGAITIMNLDEFIDRYGA